MVNKNFSAVFFKIYDRKISSGEIVFKELGMPHNDFTMLCTTDGHIPPAEVIERLCVTMKLDEDEQKLFRSFIKPDDESL
ncbi:MAG: hypothetical protein SPI74_07330 [Eubacterium sp.]|nr:hypothetical protein [Eubacterium sp.]